MAGGSAVFAQEEEAPAPEDPNAVAQYVYGWPTWWMETYDLDPDEVQAEYEEEVANLSEEDAEGLLELYGASKVAEDAFDPGPSGPGSEDTRP